MKGLIKGAAVGAALVGTGAAVTGYATAGDKTISACVHAKGGAPGPNLCQVDTVVTPTNDQAATAGS